MTTGSALTGANYFRARFSNTHEGSIPFTRSIDNQGLAQLCRKSAGEERNMSKLRVFISSVQNELENERLAVLSLSHFQWGQI